MILRLFFSTGGVGVGSGCCDGDLSGSGFRPGPGSGFRPEFGRWLLLVSGSGLGTALGRATRAEASGSGFLSATGEAEPAADGSAFLSVDSGAGFRTASGRGLRTLILPEADGAGDEDTRGILDPFVSVDGSTLVFKGCFKVIEAELVEGVIDLVRHLSGRGTLLCISASF
jgi:hypothetical protein